MIKTANLTHSVSRNAGGLYESVRRLVQSLGDLGMQVSVFGTEDEHTAADIGAWAPVEVRAFRPMGPHQFGFSPQFGRALQDFSPDLVHTHGLWAYSSVVTNQYRRRRGVPYVISAHGMLDPWAVNNSRWKKAVAYFFYEGAHLGEARCLRALCEPEARAIRQLGLKNPIAIIPNGIDLPEENQKPGVRSQKSEISAPIFDLRSLASGRKVLLYLGRIHPKKGLVNLLKAWAALQKSETNSRKSEWILVIAGWDQGGHEAELKQLATELGIVWKDARNQKSEVRSQTSDLHPLTSGAASLLFLGPQFSEGKMACYQNCDAFVLPSVSEGLPMVILEAWAYGKPVVMTPECNLPEGFAAGAALRIEPNVQSIVQGLDQLLQSSPADRDSMGAKGLRLVREKYVWPLLGKETAGLYEWLLGGGSKPACIY